MDGISGTAQATKRQPAQQNAAARIQARYWIETAFPLEDAAEIMAGEQSTGTFIRVPGETSELRARFAAKVEQITELETVDRPSCPAQGRRRTRPTAFGGLRRLRFPGRSKILAHRSPTFWPRSPAISSS